MLGHEAQQQSYENLNPMENPFLRMETVTHSGLTASTQTVQSESFQSPFADQREGLEAMSFSETLFSEALEELRDEGFDEAVANLAEETDEAVSNRLLSEAPGLDSHRERLAEAHLAPVALEVEQYLTNLSVGLEGKNLQSLNEQQMSELLDSFDPETSTHSIGGEQFIGGLIRKAKSVVNFVKKAAGTVGKAIGGLLGPVLEKLKKFVKPLLKRVLGFAIGKLPGPIQPAARMLADRIFGAGEASEQEVPASPSNLVDTENVAESFDESVAHALTLAFEGNLENETLENNEAYETESDRTSNELTEARNALIEKIANAGDNENLELAFEQFVPVLLGALRLGINLVGRPKVVGFLAGYLAKLIGRFVGPSMAGPLSNAIVDVGMRLLTLEAEHGEQDQSKQRLVAPVALAAVVEDTIRRISENESYVLENQELMQLAAAEAFGEAIATHLPQQFVRSDLQQSPSLGGTFVVRKPMTSRRYGKYNRAPEIEVTPQVADALPSFGGSTLGASLRASGIQFPFRARVHIYQAVAGTTLPSMVRLDRRGKPATGSFLTTGNIHPLTTQAAGLLMREPRLGADVPPRFVRSKNRIAIGQRFFVLEPTTQSNATMLGAGAASLQRVEPSRAWLSVNLRKATVFVSIYFSEVEAQEIAAAIRQARGSAPLLQALVKALRGLHLSPMRSLYGAMEVLEQEQFSATVLRRYMPRRLVTMLRGRLSGWVLPTLAAWAKSSADVFARNAGHSASGVTVRIVLSNVPLLPKSTAAAAPSALGRSATTNSTPLGKPAVTITVHPGRFPKS